jgi:uncharacterized protein YdeI (YjbR/CyaY-like superfamily)
MKLAKKATGIPSVTYPEALDEALCYGWIDGQKDRFDAKWWLQKFTPRQPRSIWSKINKGKVQELIASGRMKPAGLNEIERAKQDGRWEAAYESWGSAAVPDDLQAALDRNAKARAAFGTLSSGRRYAFLFRIYTAKKPETRAKRIERCIQFLSSAVEGTERAEKTVRRQTRGNGGTDRKNS